MSYTLSQESQKAEIRKRVKAKFPNLCENDFNNAFDMSVSDYMAIRFPSYNERPDVASLNFDFFINNWIYKRIIDILERVGLNLKSYSENGLRWEYANGNIDPMLVSSILPKAGVPK